MPDGTPTRPTKVGGYSIPSEYVWGGAIAAGIAGYAFREQIWGMIQGFFGLQRPGLELKDVTIQQIYSNTTSSTTKGISAFSMPSPPTGVVNGRVVQKGTDTGVAGATVEVRDARTQQVFLKTTSGADGSFTATHPALLTPSEIRATSPLGETEWITVPIVLSPYAGTGTGTSDVSTQGLAVG